MRFVTFRAKPQPQRWLDPIEIKNEIAYRGVCAAIDRRVLLIGLAVGALLMPVVCRIVVA